jgi:hypothetical protein
MEELGSLMKSARLDFPASQAMSRAVYLLHLSWCCLYRRWWRLDFSLAAPCGRMRWLKSASRLAFKPATTTTHFARLEYAASLLETTVMIRLLRPSLARLARLASPSHTSISPKSHGRPVIFNKSEHYLDRLQGSRVMTNHREYLKLPRSMS